MSVLAHILSEAQRITRKVTVRPSEWINSEKPSGQYLGLIVMSN
jgi:hypothetical protein